MTVGLILSNKMVLRIGESCGSLGFVESITMGGTASTADPANSVDHWRVIIEEPLDDKKFLMIVKDYHVTAHMVEY
jgi:hypothetical protein